jgi:UDP-glucose 4-epimerase
MAARRPGDIAECWADPAYAAQVLGWSAKRSLPEMCADSWRWQQFRKVRDESIKYRNFRVNSLRVSATVI